MELVPYEDIDGFRAVRPTPNRYVLADSLRRGDILLTCSRLGAVTIAPATRGPFSHAAVAVNEGYVVESTKAGGVSFRCLNPEVCWINGKPVQLIPLSSLDCLLASIYRLPGLEEEQVNSVAQAMQQVTAGVLATRYSQRIRLLRALPGLAGKVGTKFADRLTKPANALSGPFCSELAAATYAAAGRAVTPGEPDTTSPNDLARSGHSRLRPVENIIVDVSPEEMTRYPHAENPHPARLSEYESKLRKLRGKRVGIEARIQEMDRIFLNFAEKILQR